MSFKTPILFLVFNRMDTTRQVFEKIRKIAPEKLYIASDGARKDKENEKQVVEEIRRYLLDSIDWQCEVKTLFREENLGCKYAVSGAITWFFQNEEMGIILEDDCLPTISFFRFCEECLNKYKNDERIMQVNGWTGIENNKISEKSYWFSKYTAIWGWASWRRAWSKYEIENKNFEKDFIKIKENFNSTEEETYWYKIFKEYFNNKIDTWDYPWTFTVWKNNGMAIFPKLNMIQNIGMGHIEATHTKDKNSLFSKLLVHEDIGDITHPKIIEINIEMDMLNYKLYSPLSFKNRIINKLKRIFG